VADFLAYCTPVKTFIWPENFLAFLDDLARNASCSLKIDRSIVLNSILALACSELLVLVRWKTTLSLRNQPKAKSPSLLRKANSTNGSSSSTCVGDVSLLLYQILTVRNSRSIIPVHSPLTHRHDWKRSLVLHVQSLTFSIPSRSHLDSHTRVITIYCLIYRLNIVHWFDITFH